MELPPGTEPAAVVGIFRTEGAALHSEEIAKWAGEQHPDLWKTEPPTRSIQSMLREYGRIFDPVGNGMWGLRELAGEKEPTLRPFKSQHGGAVRHG